MLTGRIVATALAAVLTAGSVDAQTSAERAYAAGAQALQAGQWTEAETHLEAAREGASPEMLDEIAFLQGYAVYKQGEIAARANVTGDLDQARIVLGHFQRALSLLEGTTHQQRDPLRNAITEYIANQEAIIRLSPPQ